MDKNNENTSQSSWSGHSPEELDALLQQRMALEEQRSELDSLIDKHRKPISIMFTDIVGSTQFFEQHGDIDGRIMLARHNSLLFPIVSQYSGKIIKTIGDAIMATFDNAGQAVECACDMQRTLHQHNCDITKESRIHIKIGINSGRALQEQSDVYGDEVNLAARIVSKCRGDQLLISDTTYSQLDPYLKRLCLAPKTSKVRGKSEAVMFHSVQWQQNLTTISDTRNEKAVFLDVVLKSKQIRISCNEGDEVEETLTHYEDNNIDREALNNVSERIQNNFRMAVSLDGGNAETLQNMKQLGEQLYNLIFNDAIQKKLAQSDARYLLINLDDQSVGIPWEVMYDGEHFLCRRFAMGRMVKTSHKVVGKPRPAPLTADLLVVSNPRGDLAAASEEGNSIGLEFASSPRVRVHKNDSAATCADVEDGLQQADILHYGGHAIHDDAQPENSGWLLRDGTLTAGDIVKHLTSEERMFPRIVFSNACRTGQTDRWTGDNAVYGMASAFLLAGVQHYIGTFWEVLSAPSGDMAIMFYRRLAGGHSIGQSLGIARQRLANDRGEENLIWASYMLYGDPRRELFGVPEIKPDSNEMMYSSTRMETIPMEEPQEQPSAPISRGAQTTAASSSNSATIFGVVTLVIAAILLGSWFTFIHQGKGGKAASLQAGLALLKQEQYDAALGIFEGLQSDDPIVAGLVASTRKRVALEQDKQAQARTSAALSEVVALLSKPRGQLIPEDIYRALRGDWTPPVLTTALMEFRVNGAPTRLGEDEWLRHRLQSAIADHPRLHVVEREFLDKVLKELSLSAAGLADPEKAVQTAKLHMVCLWISAELHYFDGSRLLTLRGTMGRTSRQIFTVEQEIGKDIKASLKELFSKVDEKLTKRLPVRGRLTNKEGDAWWVDIGSDHGVLPDSTFTGYLEDTNEKVTLKATQLDLEKCLLSLSGDNNASLATNTKVEMNQGGPGVE
jgi:class 3 adenylate cyclase